MGEMLMVPVGPLPAVRAHAFARGVMPHVAPDAYGFSFGGAQGPDHDVYLGALLARESGSYDAFRQAAGVSVMDVLTGPKPWPVFPAKVAEDDDSEACARSQRATGPVLARAVEFCERFIPRVTEEGGDRDRIALPVLHRKAVDMGLKGCPKLMIFSQAVQRLYVCVQGRNGESTAIAGRRMKSAPPLTGKPVTGAGVSAPSLSGKPLAGAPE